MDRHIWDPYAHWDAVATSDSPAELRAKITGLGDRWLPNAISYGLLKVIKPIIDERIAKDGPPVTVVDFGCGLGRNLPVLRGIFGRVVGLDIPEMINRLREEQAESHSARYDAIYDDLDLLLRSERVHFVYDSVVFQHIIDRPYVSGLIDRLIAAPSFVAMVSLSIISSPPAALELLSAEHGWNNVFTEIDQNSLGGGHQIRVLCRPRAWRVSIHNGVIGIEPEGGDWRPLTINGRLVQDTGEWDAVEVLSDLSPTLLLVFDRGGERTIWYIDGDGNFLGNKMTDLPLVTRSIISHALRQIIDRTVQRSFAGAGSTACAELLSLI